MTAIEMMIWWWWWLKSINETIEKPKECEESQPDVCEKWLLWWLFIVVYSSSELLWRRKADAIDITMRKEKRLFSVCSGRKKFGIDEIDIGILCRTVTMMCNTNTIGIHWPVLKTNDIHRKPKNSGIVAEKPVDDWYCYCIVILCWRYSEWKLMTGGQLMVWWYSDYVDEGIILLVIFGGVIQLLASIDSRFGSSWRWLSSIDGGSRGRDYWRQCYGSYYSGWRKLTTLSVLWRARRWWGGRLTAAGGERRSLYSYSMIAKVKASGEWKQYNGESSDVYSVMWWCWWPILLMEYETQLLGKKTEIVKENWPDIVASGNERKAIHLAIVIIVYWKADIRWWRRKRYCGENDEGSQWAPWWNNIEEVVTIEEWKKSLTAWAVFGSWRAKQLTKATESSWPLL